MIIKFDQPEQAINALVKNQVTVINGADLYTL
jgi:hypothetical protein